jgi:hypothetical protein
LRASSGEGGGLGGQSKNGPDFLHASNGLLAGAEAQTQFALEAAHAPGRMHQQEAVFFKASCAWEGFGTQSEPKISNIFG